MELIELAPDVSLADVKRQTEAVVPGPPRRWVRRAAYSVLEIGDRHPGVPLTISPPAASPDGGIRRGGPSRNATSRRARLVCCPIT